MAGDPALGAADEPWRLLDEAHARLGQRIERAVMNEAGLPLLHLRALAALADAPEGRRMNSLARALHMSKSGLTRLVDRLEAQGLVLRLPADDDRRAVRAALTEEGARALAGAFPAYLRSLQEALSTALTPSDLDLLSSLLRRLVEALGAGPAARG